jgi:dCTP diphosphatase
VENWTDELTTMKALKQRLTAFNTEREWGQFHQPKDLAMQVAVEAGELLEPFLWKKEGDALDIRAISAELADVIITTVNLASRLDVDLMHAVDIKLQHNAQRYPVEKARGRAEKYDQL